MEYLKKHLIAIILSAFWLIVFIRGVFFLDPDFGWHIRQGQFILAHGIPLTDPFSYTMPSYHFVDHEWLTNILLALGYKFIGIYGLAAIFAALFVIVIWFVIPQKFKNFSFIPLILAGCSMFGFAGIRPQVITWFFLALLLKLVFDDSLFKKWKLAIPLLFLFWVNLHGGFAVGIAILLVFIFVKSLQEKKSIFQNMFILIASLLCTFVNPYGLRIWWEVWMQISDTALRWNIAEWWPGIFFFEIAKLLLFALSFSFIFIYRKKIGIRKIIIYLFLLLMAISSVRHVALWALSAVLITAEAFFLFKQELKENKLGLKKLEKVKKIFAIVLLLIFLYSGWKAVTGAISFSQETYYPVKAVEFLSRQNLKGNIFTTYNFAGFLLWKLPNKKDFIDGRMPSWRRSDNYPNESNHAFRDYLKMLSDEKVFKSMLKKYNIHYLLLPVPQTVKHQEIPILSNLDKLLNRFVGGFNLSVSNEDLSKLGLKKIYTDKKFVVYQN